MKKNNYSYIGIATILLVFGIIFIPKIVDRFKEQDITRGRGRSLNISKQVKNKSIPSDLKYLKINGEPKRVPAFSFTDQNGKVITNKDYEGKVYVVEFFFTTCPTICPKMNRNLGEVQKAFTNNPDFGIASFTINPDFDSVEVLKHYAEQYEVSNKNWHLMTGNQADIYKLSNEGFNLFTAKNDDVVGGFEHSGNFALIDKKGFIRSRSDAHGNPLIYYRGTISEQEKIDDDGTKEEISALKQDIKKLLQE